MYGILREKDRIVRKRVSGRWYDTSSVNVNIIYMLGGIDQSVLLNNISGHNDQHKDGNRSMINRTSVVRISELPSGRILHGGPTPWPLECPL